MKYKGLKKRKRFEKRLYKLINKAVFKKLITISDYRRIVFGENHIPQWVHIGVGKEKRNTIKQRSDIPCVCQDDCSDCLCYKCAQRSNNSIVPCCQPNYRNKKLTYCHSYFAKKLEDKE